MRRTFASRMAKLEQLEAERHGRLDTTPLSDADYAALAGMAKWGNVQLNEAGYAVRRWRTKGNDAAIDAALARFNGFIAFNTDARQWSDQMLEVYHAMLHHLWPELETMSDAELEAFCAEDL